MSDSMPVAGLILAAGKGTRMKSNLPKCLHEVCGVPMVRMVTKAMASVGISRPTLVIGHGADEMVQELGEEFDYAEQTEQLGTGHAVLMAKDSFRDYKGPIIVACGDTPLLRPETLQKLIDKQQATNAAASMAVVKVKDPRGYGRILRDKAQRVIGIIEEKDIRAAEQELKLIDEINPALYCFDCETLFRCLPDTPSEATGEFYLTDVIGAINQEGGSVEAVVFTDEDEFMGVNDRWQLAKAAKALRMRVLEEHARAGVTIVDPDSTFVGAEVVIEPDTVIEPMTVIDGMTTIGAGSRIGPNTWVKDSKIGRSARVFMSHLDQAEMQDGSRCGPFANLRPHTVLGPKAKIGNFVELKNAKIGAGTSVSHLTYIGDAEVGESSNIGAGTITCNYDGYAKHRTVIGSNAFVGSNSTLVAPVTIGDGAMTAAGSVVTKDVPGDSLAVGRARQENKDGWVPRWRSTREDS